MSRQQPQLQHGSQPAQDGLQLLDRRQQLHQHLLVGQRGLLDRHGRDGREGCAGGRHGGVRAIDRAQPALRPIRRRADAPGQLAAQALAVALQARERGAAGVGAGADRRQHGRRQRSRVERRADLGLWDGGHTRASLLKQLFVV